MRPIKFYQTRHGFTLVETMVAMAIMTIAWATILMIQSKAIDNTTKAENLNRVAMLAKNMMVETEKAIEGKAFTEIKTEEEGSFAEPFQDYSWKREIKEVKMPLFSAGGASTQSESGSSDSPSSSGAQSALMGKLVSNYLSKAIRQVTVTVIWKRGPGNQTYAVSTYWVNLNSDFQITQ